MTDSFVGQIQVFPYSFTPVNWVICDGRTLPINQNVALFSLLGTYFGGDGRTTFGIPNLLGRATYGGGYGGGPNIGAATGTTTVTLDQTQIAAHTHSLVGTTQPGTALAAAGNAFATTAVGSKGSGSSGFNRYSTSNTNTALAPGSLSNTGGSQPHNNMQPYLGMNYYICLYGNFPERP